MLFRNIGYITLAQDVKEGSQSLRLNYEGKCELKGERPTRNIAYEKGHVKSE